MSDFAYWKTRWSDQALEPPNNFAVRAYRLIRAKKLKTLLDLGCGDGRDSVYFHEKGLEVTAEDFSESGIMKLKVRESGVKAIQKNIQDIRFPKHSFDVIYAHLSLHYFDDRTTRKIFDKLYTILKKGGLIFIACKSTDDPLFGKGEKITENMYRKGHVRHFFTKEYMKKQLKDFKILNIKKTSSTYSGYKSSFIEAIATT